MGTVDRGLLWFYADRTPLLEFLDGPAHSRPVRGAVASRSGDLGAALDEQLHHGLRMPW